MSAVAMTGRRVAAEKCPKHWIIWILMFSLPHRWIKLLFARKQTRELFAYLVDWKGVLSTSEEIATALWEGDWDDLRNTKTQIRVLISDLRKTLANIGQEEVVIRRRSQIAIQKEKLDCDYYRMIEGDMDAVNAYNGEYMSQYSWAEITAGQLMFEKLRHV